MAIRIGKIGEQKDPFWLELVFGVRVKVRPLTTTIYEAAKARAADAVAKIKDEVAGIKEVGGDVTNLPNLDDANERTGLTTELFYRGLALAGIVEWEGVVNDATGEPLPVNDDNVTAVMRVAVLSENFFSQYTGTIDAMIAEGNGSPAAPNGISAEGAAGDTAGTAEK